MKKCVINIKYEGEDNYIEYPMNKKDPLVLTLKYPFTKEINDFTIIILTREINNKFKKVAKGKINFYRHQILSEQLRYEKYIHLELYKSQLDSIKNLYTSTDIIATIGNIGKIFMKAQIFDYKLSKPEKKSVSSKELSSITQINFFDGNTDINNPDLKSYTKQILNNIRTFLSENPEYLKEINNKQNVNNQRFKSIVQKTNDMLRSKQKSSTKSINSIKEDVKNELSLNIDSFNDSILDKNKKPHFNDGLSELSQEIENEKEKIYSEIANDDNVLNDLNKANDELEELVNKFMTLFQDKYKDKE